VRTSSRAASTADNTLGTVPYRGARQQEDTWDRGTTTLYEPSRRSHDFAPWRCKTGVDTDGFMQGIPI